MEIVDAISRRNVTEVAPAAIARLEEEDIVGWQPQPPLPLQSSDQFPARRGQDRTRRSCHSEFGQVSHGSSPPAPPPRRRAGGPGKSSIATCAVGMKIRLELRIPVLPGGNQ